jgi:hypothetical protein
MVGTRTGTLLRMEDLPMRRILTVCTLFLALLICVAPLARADGVITASCVSSPTGSEVYIWGAAGQYYCIRSAGGSLLACGTAATQSWVVPVPTTEGGGVWVTVSGESHWVATNSAGDMWWE